MTASRQRAHRAICATIAHSGLASSPPNRFVLAAHWTSMKPIDLIVLLLMNLIWATVYSAYKIIGETVPASTGCIVTLRFGLAGICLLLVWPWLPGKAPRGKDFIVTCA